MDDGNWLEFCKKHGQINETDTWIKARREQIRSSALLLSLLPAISLVSLMCVLTVLAFVINALRRRSIHLRSYAFTTNQLLVEGLTLSVIVFIGWVTDLRDALNAIGFLVFLISVFAFTSIGMSQVVSTFFNLIRSDCSSFYSRIRVEFVLITCVLIWFVSGGCVVVFSPLFFVLDFAQTSKTSDCPFYSCQSPLLLSFLLIMTIVWFVNMLSYSFVLFRLHKKIKKERSQSDAPLAKQILQIHWLSVGPVTLFAVVGLVCLFVTGGIARAIYELHQLRVQHLQCQMEKRLELFAQMQILGSILLVLWILRSAASALSVLIGDYLNLVPGLQKTIPSVKTTTPKIQCCTIDRVSWTPTI